MFESTTTMMKSSKFLIVLTLLGVSASFWQCGGDSSNPPDPKDEQIKKLSHTWKASAVTFNSTPVTGYDNFVLTISGTAGNTNIPYTTAGLTGMQTPWPGSGNFQFGTDFSTTLKRDDHLNDMPITYSVNATTLQMTFNYTCPTCTAYTGRTSVVNGSWTFTFAIQ